MAYLKRFTELALAVLLACTCALTIWACWYMLAHPEERLPRWTALQIAFVLASSRLQGYPSQRAGRFLAPCRGRPTVGVQPSGASCSVCGDDSPGILERRS